MCSFYHLHYSFFDRAIAFLKSLNKLERLYISTPPLYTRAPKIPNKIIETTNKPIANTISQAGIFNIPTRKNITIGVKNGIYEEIVTNFESGTLKPNMAMKKAIITKKTIGMISC